MKTRRIIWRAMFMVGLGMSVGAALAAGPTASNVVCNGCVDSTDIADGAVTNTKFGANAVTGDKVLDGSLTGADIQSGSIGNAKLANSAVTINPGAGLSGGGPVSLGGTTTLSIPNGGVTNPLLAADSVDGNKIADGTIANADLASGSFSNITGVGTLGSLTVSGATNLATTSGNVGIGTTAPTNTLSVVGSADFSVAVLSPLYQPLPGDGNSLTIQANGASSSVVAGTVSIKGGGAGSGSSGPSAGGVTMAGGDSASATAGGGSVAIIGGAVSDVSLAPPGAVTITGGTAHSSGGSVAITGGASRGADGGDVTISGGGGVPGFGSSGGKVTIKGGFGDIPGGDVVIAGGPSSHTEGGEVFFQTSGAERARITRAGNVGIGTTSPDQLLSVNGNASKVGGGSWAVFSDDRLKTIKGRFSYGLSEVLKLNPIHYRYKQDNPLGIPDEAEHVGFSAEEVQKVIPEAVSENSKGYLLLNNDPILWAMLNAIKEQQKEIEGLRNKIQHLETQLMPKLGLMAQEVKEVVPR